jgi:hypothetical protein
MDQGFQSPSAFKQQQQQQQQDAADCLAPRRWSLSASKDCFDSSQQLPAVHLTSSCSKLGKDQTAASAGLGYTFSLDCWDANRSSSTASFEFKLKKHAAARTASVATSTCSSSCYKAQSSSDTTSSSTYIGSCKAHSTANTTTSSSSSSPTRNRSYQDTTGSSSSSSSSSSSPLQPCFTERDLAVLKKLQGGSLASEAVQACLGQLDSLVTDVERSTVLGCGSYGE